MEESTWSHTIGSVTVTLAVLLALAGSGTSSQPDVAVMTSRGVVVGTSVRTDPPSSVADYDAFLGIPYGEQPTRFQRAVARRAWGSLLQAKRDGPACPQPKGYVDSYSEDCLYLNVFTPPGASSSSRQYPVIVFFHGSGFTVTSSSSESYGPDFLVPRGIVLVTFNYRLGAPGFLSLGSRVAPGNLGLFDSLLALQWVQTEIAVFGGLPSSVTLMGQSAGAAMALYHCLSPLSTGLFQRVIAQSGSPLAVLSHTTPQQASARARQLARLVQCDSSQEDVAVLACLQRVDIQYLVGNQSLLTLSNEEMAVGTFAWIPVLDTKSTTDTPFLGDSLDNRMSAAVANNKPILIGFNAQDGALFLDNHFGTYQNADGHLVAFLKGNARNSGNVQKISSTYFKPDILQNKVANYISLYTDYDFAYPSVQISRYYANTTYGYLFSYEGAWGDSFTPRRQPSVLAQHHMRGVSHGEELAYLFYSQGAQQSQDTCDANHDDIKMMRAMVQWWTSFAKTGSPDSTGAWPTVDKAGYLVIASRLSMMSAQELEGKYSFAFWDAMAQAASAASTPTTATLSFLSAILLSTGFKVLANNIVFR